MSFAPLILPCPAKLNLFLHITGKRSDGYHNLQTLFQLLNYGDELSLSPATDHGIHFRSEPAIDTGNQSNLVVQAANALLKYAGAPADELAGVNLSLLKRLPIGGGIGGGSSNAASALLGLNHVWQLNLAIDELADIASTLGADVPVFVRGHTAWAEGIGERLKPVQIPLRWYVVIKPHCAISTIDIFSHKELTRDSRAITLASFLELGGKNDCQPLVERLYPQVKSSLDWLNRYSPAQLTGTGSCIFAAFDDEATARQAFASRPMPLEGFIAKGVNASPVHKRLETQM